MKPTWPWMCSRSASRSRVSNSRVGTAGMPSSPTTLAAILIQVSGGPFMEGILVSIHVAAAAKARMQTLSEVRAVPGAGLEGDRYFMRQGTFYKPEPDFELTLIEAEAIEALSRDYKVELAVGDA